MTVIVTGGAGFIGSNFIFHMLDSHPDYRIVCLDKLTYAGNLATLESVMDNPSFRFVRADIADRDAVYALFEEEKPDIIVNFAAESHVDRSIENPEIFLRTNIIGTSVLMDACRKYGIKRYHQVSTDEVYGDLPLDRPDLFIINALHDKPLPVYGKGENVRDWLYVEDHCRAIDLIIHNGRVGEVYNVGGHNEMRNIDIVKLILKELGKSEDLITFVTDRKGHDLRYAIDPAKIHRELGWLPETKFSDGLKKTIRWYLDNESWWRPVISGEYQEYYEKMYSCR